MKITRIETIWLEDHPRLLFVRVHTDEGLVGLGETYSYVTSEPVVSYIHTAAAASLLGQDPLRIDHHWKTLYDGVRTPPGKGVEIRGISAIDVALWDLWGQATNQPVYQLLGGKSRDRIKVYNTCAGYGYGGQRSAQIKKAEAELDPIWIRMGARPPTKDRPYEDLWGFLVEPERLAESLLSQGVKAMKIWPFDVFAEYTRGQYISLEDLKKGAEPFRRIRQAVGDQMEIAVELHNRWNLQSAVRIAKALEEYNPIWYEDPVPMDNLDALLRFKESTHIATCASETVSTRWGFREMFEKGATDIAMLDVTWTGGLSEAKKIATMAEAYHLPVAPHDCTGPVTLMANVHLCMNVPNAIIQETVRSFLNSWYRDLVDRLPEVKDGYVYAPEGPGLGTALRPEVLQRKDAHVQVSEKG